MATEAFIGGVFLERGGDGSPTTFTRICQVSDLPGFGQRNELVDVTTFCSAGVREYIGGLADGQEFTIEANLELGSTALFGMIDDVKNKVTRPYRIVVNDVANSLTKTFYFDAAAIAWEFAPSIEAQNKINYTFKISGQILIV